MATTAIGGSLTAASPLLAFQTLDAGVVGVEVSGTWTGTITFEARIGNTWANAQVFTVAGVAAAATTTANVSRLINAAGFSEVRANFSTPTSGSPTVIFTGSPEAMGGGGGGGGGGGAATIADGADAAEGTTTDAGIITDTSGTVIGFLRGAIIQWAKLLTQTGIVTETAPATDTASSGLNGRLQRIAQRLTSLIALLPSALVSGRLDVNLGAAPATVTTAGAKTNNNAAPGATNTGTLPALANAADPTWVEGNQVSNSADLRGRVRVVASGYIVKPSATLTRGANTTAYTIGDEVGTSGTSAGTISVARANGLPVWLYGLRAVYSNAPSVTPSLRVLLFNDTVTLAGDNAQLALSDADAAKFVGYCDLSAVQTGSYSAGASVTSGNLMMQGSSSHPIAFVPQAGVALIYFAVITLNAYTPIANSETLLLMADVDQS